MCSVYSVIRKSWNPTTVWAFNGNVWKTIMQENGVRHRKITPLWPQANAQAEAFNTPLTKAIITASISGTSWREEMRKFLSVSLMVSRDPQTKLPEVMQYVSADDEVMRGNYAAADLKMKSRADKRTRAKTTTLNEGDVVLVRRQNTGKLPCRAIRLRWLWPAKAPW